MFCEESSETPSSHKRERLLTAFRSCTRVGERSHTGPGVHRQAYKKDIIFAPFDRSEKRNRYAYTRLTDKKMSLTTYTKRKIVRFGAMYALYHA